MGLWLHALDAMPSPAALAALAPQERSRAERFHFERDRRRYLAARAALRGLLAAHLGTTAGELRFTEGPQGKPRLVDPPDCRFNLSHSGDLALIAIGGDAELGVDLEELAPMPDAVALARLHYTAAEREALECLPPEGRDAGFLRLWTRKEACLKALGTGLSLAPSSFQVGLAPGPAQVSIDWAGRRAALEVHDVATGAPAVAALAWCLDG